MVNPGRSPTEMEPILEGCRWAAVGMPRGRRIRENSQMGGYKCSRNGSTMGAGAQPTSGPLWKGQCSFQDVEDSTDTG